MTLEFLDGALRPDMRTVETGAGASTVLFAAKSAGHTCIAPDAALFRRIRHYCSSVGVDDRLVAFIGLAGESIEAGTRHVSPEPCGNLRLWSGA